MNINLDLSKIYKSPAFIIAVTSFMGVGSYLSGLAPVLAYQLQTVEAKIDNFACITIIAEFLRARDKYKAIPNKQSPEG